MILWGLMDSPFVRRVAVALHHHGCAYQRRPLSVFRDFETMRAANPLGQAPVLTLASGAVLTDSRAILEWLDATHPATSLTPAGDAMLAVLQVEAVALSLADKAVLLMGELIRRPVALRDPEAIARLQTQVTGALDWLEDRAQAAPLFERLTRADLALACATKYLAEKQPRRLGERPALMRHSRWCEAQPPFAAAPYSAAEAMATGWRPEPEEEKT
ncbi:glutathione S-transferase family protein [Pararhodobacter sp.]|uniref:glutathione S-transferase family protein n=1 Tax=Pararhodobacter sp. TaxID=2127056 RepID=UPI002FE0BF85|nr:glutathione S-transferase family protein [Pseudomonadota bacterium]